MNKKERKIRWTVKQIRNNISKTGDTVMRYSERSDNIVLNALQFINVIAKNPNFEAKVKKKNIYDQGFVCKMHKNELDLPINRAFLEDSKA